MFCIMHALMEWYGVDKVAGITGITSLALLRILMPFFLDSEEQRREKLNQCERIVENTEQFMTYGEPN